MYEERNIAIAETSIPECRIATAPSYDEQDIA